MCKQKCIYLKNNERKVVKLILREEEALGMLITQSGLSEQRKLRINSIYKGRMFKILRENMII